MAEISPLYLRPLVGYAMSRMGRKDRTLKRYLTPDETLAAMQAKDEYTGIPEAEMMLAISFALENLSASQAAKLMADNVWRRDGGTIADSAKHSIRPNI